MLADVRPPYGVRELAGASGLTAGYISRLLDALDQDALVDRDRRGRVEAVDLSGLLRAWADAYDVFARDRTTTYVARSGAAEALTSLADAGVDAAVTGSFAAVRLAPVAAPALLAVFCLHPELLADRIGLLPADGGANVVLILPFDDVVFERTSLAAGVRYDAPSQV